MRAFLLVALFAMATTVSCAISPLCNSTTDAIHSNTTITALQTAITKTGCTELDDNNPNSPQCTKTAGRIDCVCNTILSNTTAWSNAVVAASGVACTVSLTITINGTENNGSTPITWVSTHNNLELLAVGNCTTDEISSTLFEPMVTKGVSGLTSDLNSNSTASGLLWTSGSATITGCGTFLTVTKPIAPYVPSPTTTSPPTTPTGGNGTTTPPTQPSGGSSTGGKGNGVAALGASTTLVAALFAAVIIAA